MKLLAHLQKYMILSCAIGPYPVSENMPAAQKNRRHSATIAPAHDSYSTRKHASASADKLDTARSGDKSVASYANGNSVHAKSSGRSSCAHSVSASAVMAAAAAVISPDLMARSDASLCCATAGGTSRKG